MINLGFLTEGKLAAILITPSSWGSQWAGHSPCTRTNNYLSKNLQNTSHFVTLFLAHRDAVVGFAIFHIVYSKKKKK
jgi:hypothetical protein